MAESTKGYGQLGPSINWGGLFAGLSNDITKNQQLQLQAKRKKQLKMEEDQIASVREAAKFGELEYTPKNFTGNNSFQDIIQGTTNQIKNNYLDISKNPNLSNLQKNIYKQNTADDMDQLANISKSFNDVAQQIQGDSEKGQSNFSAYQGNRYMSQIDLSNKSVKQGPDGHLVWTQDVDGVEVQMTMPQLQNLYVNSPPVDLNKDLKQVSSGWGSEDSVNPITGVKTRSFKNNPDFAFAVSSYITKTLDPSNPRDAWSVIADNGYTKVNDLGYPQKYALYSTASEKNNILDKKLAEFRIGMGLDKMVPDLDKDNKQQQNKDGTVKMKTEPGRDITKKEAEDFLIETEGYLIATGTDSLGMPIPLLTEQFYNDAGDFITKTIDTQLGSTISSAPGKKTNRGGVNPPKKKELSKQYELFRKGWEKAAKGDVSQLQRRLKKGYKINNLGNGLIEILKPPSATEQSLLPSNSPEYRGVEATIDLKDINNQYMMDIYTGISADKMGVQNELYNQIDYSKLK